MFRTYLQIYCCFLALFFLSNPANSKEAETEKNDLTEVYKVDAMLLVPIAAIGLSQWDWGGFDFSTKNEGFFGENTDYGGADKAGHFYSSYILSDLLTKEFKRRKIDQQRAPIYGAASGLFLTTLVEIGDSTTKKHGFSFEDQLMNSLGTLSSYILETNPGLDKKIDFRIEYVPRKNSFGNRLLDDYEQMRYFINLKLSGFDCLKDTPWGFFELQSSYRTRGYVNDEAFRKREISIGIGIDIVKVIDYFSKNRTNKYVSGFFEYYQPPYTYVNENRKL